MDLRRLEHFLALYEHGTFNRAADAVHLSQSALSRSIQGLEDELEVTLFDRLVQGTVLTPAGRLLLPGATKLIADAKELRRQATLFRTGDLAEIRIGTSPTPGAVLLRPLILNVARARPALHIHARIASNEDLLNGLRTEKFDFVVLDATFLESPEGLEIEQLRPQAGGFLVRQGHPLAQNPELDISQIHQYQVTAVNSTAAFGLRLVEALGPEAHPSRLITHYCDSYEVQRDLALRTDAVMLSLYAIVKAEIEDRSIVPLSIRTLAPMPLGLYAMVRLVNRTSSPALDFVRQLVREAFDDSVPGGGKTSPVTAVPTCPE
ncbi:LysR family transcriptional regulator [Variovorax sp. J22R115]|uniref:LysR family transcriptional regulator n=1 Tax=Variovorax sp. J22R115 TaxID=3053509 RepID=UPI0025783D6E|nr:LysR family transcriptional regulator [Variovorax sp. J22R115]MDM0047389.1 LysR family transcriptional regulator [Variovorax sp. J22R115]